MPRLWIRLRSMSISSQSSSPQTGSIDCKDALEILQHPADVHSPLLVKVFMGGLLTLSVMQVIWLGQIVLKLKEELGGMLSKAKAA